MQAASISLLRVHSSLLLLQQLKFHICYINTFSYLKIQGHVQNIMDKELLFFNKKMVSKRLTCLRHKCASVSKTLICSSMSAVVGGSGGSFAGAKHGAVG